MFGIIGKKSEELPQPPSAQDILEDLDKAGPDDVVFTIDIAQFDLETNPKPGQDFQLKKRFESTKTIGKDKDLDSETSDLYEKVIAYNQNVEKLDTLRQKLSQKLENLQQSKEELTEDLLKVAQEHSEAVNQHRRINDNAGNDNPDSV